MVANKQAATFLSIVSFCNDCICRVTIPQLPLLRSAIEKPRKVVVRIFLQLGKDTEKIGTVFVCGPFFYLRYIIAPCFFQKIL